MTIEIKVLGPGCSKCKKLAESATTAAHDLGLDARIEKVTKIEDMLSYGIMVTPALVVDGKVVSTGRALTVAEVKKILAPAP